MTGIDYVLDQHDRFMSTNPVAEDLRKPALAGRHPFRRYLYLTTLSIATLMGTLFLLLPTCGFIFVISLPYVSSSFMMGERSVEGNGLPFLYVLKSLLLIMPVLLSLQGIANLIRHASALTQLANTTEGK